MATARGVDRFLGQFKSIGSSYYQESKPSIDLRDVVACLWVSVVHLGDAPGLSPVYDDAPPCVAGPDATTRGRSFAKAR